MTRRRWPLIVLAAAVLLTGWFFLLPIFLAPVDNLRTADAIIVISGGGAERLAKGIELYHDGWSKKLLLSGNAVDPASPSNAETMRAAAMQAGVPEAAIVVDPEAWTTYQNATYAKRLMPYAQTIILVTSTYHQRRAAMTFRAVFGPDIEIINQPAPVPFFALRNWFRTEKGRQLLLSEYGKIFYSLFTKEYE